MKASGKLQPTAGILAIPRSRGRRGRIARALLVGTVLRMILIVGAITMVFPFIWMLSTSLKEPATAIQIPPVWFPLPLRWENYLRAWTVLPFFDFTKNSVVYASPSRDGGRVLTWLSHFDPPVPDLAAKLWDTNNPDLPPTGATSGDKTWGTAGGQGAQKRGLFPLNESGKCDPSGKPSPSSPNGFAILNAPGKVGAIDNMVEQTRKQASEAGR